MRRTWAMLSSVLVGVVLPVAACGGDEDESYLQTYGVNEVELTSVPTITGPDGAPMAGNWGAFVTIQKSTRDGVRRGTVRIRLQGDNEAYVSLEYGSHDPIPSTYDVVGGNIGGYANAPGKMAIAARTGEASQNGDTSNDTTDATGTVEVTRSSIRDGASDSYELAAELSGVKATGPGGTVEMDGTLRLSAREPGSTSGSSGGSSGSGSGKCTSSYQGPNDDIQRDSQCQAAWSAVCNGVDASGYCKLYNSSSWGSPGKCPYC